MDKPLDFVARLAMYVDAVGVTSCRLAWDCAALPMSDQDHREFASMLIRGPE